LPNHLPLADLPTLFEDAELVEKTTIDNTIGITKSNYMKKLTLEKCRITSFQKKRNFPPPLYMMSHDIQKNKNTISRLAPW
jgi:hypothetical protein